ncbi:MAG TPA: FtsX-like permease family protein [Phenylobacterium sp.]|uniref:ABC transporter permease n=1 Tax=Phenylobacterium sp. TaxID=1871053 RepID=UPI002BD99DF6|nr:FtsX-like permease family protein [Phenylobacterium sp.]HSV04630.1 FtsX-like permease family protein [Phenylobacterium sp.]
MTPLALRFAARELRSGVRGFRIFLACLALGVAAIAAAGSTAEAFRQGLASQAREILGGDLSITVQQRRFSPQERAYFASLGRVSVAAANRAMAEAPSGERRLVELRGIEGDYPLAGKVTLRGAPSLGAALRRDGDAWGAAVEQSLLDRLHLKLGDRFLAGNVPIVARAVLLEEPDRLARGFALGPRVLTRMGALQAGGFLTPGLPFGETVRIALRPGLEPKPAMAAIKKAFPGEAFRIRDRDDAAPGVERVIDQLEYFLGFIGLASLVAGGLGVFGAVSAYLEARKPAIATLKALGAQGALVRDLYLIQIGVLAALGVAIGLAAGAAAPLILGALVKHELPVPALFAVYPWPLAKAAAFGLLSAAAFSLAPLARARATPPASLFRSDLSGALRFGPEIVGAGLAAAGLAALAIVTAPTPLAAGIMIGGVAAAFLLLWAIGWGAARAAGRARGAARGPVRIGLANLAGPRSAARTAAPAIGLGVGLLAAVVLIQSSLLAEVTEVAPQTAPALVFTDIPGDRAAEFDGLVRRAFGQPLTRDTYLRVPFLTGRIVKVRGRPVDAARLPRSERWAYDNDVSLSAIGPEPPNPGITDGRWWPARYAGPPLAALDEDVAKATNLKVGESVTLSILGREIDARVAALRKVEFGSFGASFALVVTPDALAGAHLHDVAIAKASRAQEQRVIRVLAGPFPQVNVISVREQLEAATELFDRVALAVRGAAAVAALAGLLVLAGAIAARARERTREAATLKVLGASRAQILFAYVLEYGAVGAIAGAAGVALGYAAAWPVVVKVFKVHWSVDWTGVGALLGGAAALAAIGGLLAAFQALSKRPAPALRTE